MSGRRSPARVLLLVAAAVLGLGALAVAGGVFLLHTFVPTNYDLLIRNETDAEITDVRILRGDGGPGDVELTKFQRIPARGSALAEDAGTGRFSLEFSDARGRWIAPRMLTRDDDDCYGHEPHEIIVSDGRVGRTPVQPRR